MKDATSRLSVGITGKYTMGHFMAIGNQSTGSAAANPTAVTLHFPVIHTAVSDEEGGFDQNSGNGVGIDIGAAYETGALTISGAVQNVVNSFKWDADKLYFRQGELLLNKDTTSSSFDSQTLASARAANLVPQSLLDRVDNMKFKPVIALGGGYQVNNRLKADVDARFGSDGGISADPKTHLGAGVEYKLLSFLPVRVGGAILKFNDDSSGSQIGGGIGLNLAGFNLAASAQHRSTDLGHDTIVMLTILSRGM
jgi:hypothetical protein